MSGNLSDRRWLAAAAPSDLDLSARDIELRWAAGVVDGELFNAQEVLSSRDLGGDSDGVGTLACVSATTEH
jgi:hypothetical protein